MVDLTEEDFDFMSIDDRGDRKKILAHKATAHFVNVDAEFKALEQASEAAEGTDSQAAASGSGGVSGAE